MWKVSSNSKINIDLRYFKSFGPTCMVFTHINLKIVGLSLKFTQLDMEVHSVISPQNFGEKSGFSKGFCLVGSHFSKCLGRKGFGEEFEFSDFCLGGKSDF